MRPTSTTFTPSAADALPFVEDAELQRALGLTADNVDGSEYIESLQEAALLAVESHVGWPLRAGTWTDSYRCATWVYPSAELELSANQFPNGGMSEPDDLAVNTVNERGTATPYVGRIAYMTDRPSPYLLVTDIPPSAVSVRVQYSFDPRPNLGSQSIIQQAIVFAARAIDSQNRGDGEEYPAMARMKRLTQPFVREVVQ